MSALQRAFEWAWYKIVVARAETQPVDPASSRLLYIGRQPSGLYVTPDTSLRDATVWACVQYLTRAVGQLPWRALMETPSGGHVAAIGRDATDIDWLLHHRPCPDMGSFSWRQAMLGTALLWGNSYAEIERNNRGTPVALWPIHPDRVLVRRAADGGLEYDIANSATRVVLPASDVFHLRGFGDGPVGYNVVEYAAQSIGWAQATSLFGATYFGEGMNPSGVVEAANSLSPAALDQLKAAFKKLYSGPRGERTMFLDAGMKFQRLSTNPNDSQFIETRQHQVEEICRWFGVPPHKVMHLLRATFSNIEHQSIEVVVDSVTPWVKLFEEEANHKLFGATRANVYSKMDLRGLLRGDAASRAAYYKTMFELGMSINQILALEDFDGIGADGDVRFVSNNVQTLERAISGPQPAVGETFTGDQAPLPKPNGKSNGAGYSSH
jgi:HK97 family phage portal protein